MMKAPSFWYHKRGVLSLLLSPLGWVYGQATKQRLKSEGAGFRSTVPVICVGNINAGGTGKTPTCIALVERLRSLDCSPVIVSRGYGGNFEGPILVDPTHHTAKDVGDEPLLLSAFCKVVVAKDRALGAEQAQKLGDVIILDDGFQNPSVKKDLSIIVVDAFRGFGNGLCIPAGPLREPVQTGLSRADLVISIGTAEPQEKLIHDWPILKSISLQPALLTPLQTGMVWEDLPVLAFAGIGHPEKFFHTLKQMGANLIGTESLADHQDLTPALVRRLLEKAQTLGAQLVTTEKDAVRLPASFKPNVLAVPVRLQVEDWSVIDAKLQSLSI